MIQGVHFLGDVDSLCWRGLAKSGFTVVLVLLCGHPALLPELSTEIHYQWISQA